MARKLARAGLVLLAASAVIFCSAAGILGFPGGAGDGDKVPSGCAGCHSTAGSGTVTITASNDSVKTGEGINITVIVTQEELTDTGMVGVFLLKGPVGTKESVTSDGWTIIGDPNGNTRNYVERTGLSEGVPATFRWALAAPSTAGNYTVYADVRHGGEDAVFETSAAVTVMVIAAGGGESAAPLLAEPALPSRALTGSVLNISVKITDDREGVQSAIVHFRAPGGTAFTQVNMTLVNGTSMDGLWTASISVGQVPGTLELFIIASDGKKESRQPANGSLTVAVFSPGAPVIEAPVIPENAEPNSTLNISARMNGSASGVVLAVVRYRLPGATDFTTMEMARVNGTALDGIWQARIETGPVPGVLDIYIEATDGTVDTRSPASGSHAVQIVGPEGPALEVFAPSTVVYGGAPQVRAKASDKLGVLGVQIRFRQDGQSSYRAAEMTMRSGDDRDGEWSATLPAAMATGNISFFVVAKNPRADNQSAVGTIRVLADIYVSAVSLSKDDILVKQPGVLRAVIGNRGDREVTGLSVNFLDLSYPVGDIQQIRLFSNITVPANGQVTLKARWVPQVEGDREISVVLNPDGNVEDGNGENNEMRIVVPVGLEAGMGIRFPLPTLGDIWVQLVVIACIALIVAGSIVRGSMRRKRRPMSGETVDGGDVQGGRPLQGR